MQTTQVSIQSNVPVMPSAKFQFYKGIDIPLVSCYECDTVWHSVERTRCPRCARQVGSHWDATEEQTSCLMDAVSLIDEDRIERASEYESWAFLDILRRNVPMYNDNCQRTIQTCYEALLKQQPSPKIAFAIEFFERAFFAAPEDPMMYHFDEKENPSWTEDDEWDTYIEEQLDRYGL
jgi:hypothetical protein